MDGLAKTKGEVWLQKTRLQLLCAMANTYVYYDEFRDGKVFRAVMMCLAKFYCKIFDFEHLKLRIEQIRRKTSYETAQNIFMICHGSKYIIFPKAYFDHSVRMDFEYITLPVPENYDKILKAHYGDYMALPPAEKRGEHHTIYFDPDTPYREILGKMTVEEAMPLMNDY